MKTETDGKSGARGRLSVMMFLQFFVWGAWYVTAPNYLGTIGFGAGDFAWTYSVGPIAGILAPLFVGMVADRFFPAQRVLAVMHLAGGALMLLAAGRMGPGVEPAVVNWFFFGHMLCFYPTLALSNTVAMRNIGDSEKEFPLIRVFGTLGWIVAGLSLTWLNWEKGVEMFYLAGFAALVLGLFSLALPHTPPVSRGKPAVKEALGLEALVLLKDRSFAVFVAASMLICVPLAFYYQIASRVVEVAGLPIGQTMSYGQVSEVVFLLLMPLLFRRLGVKWMLAVGMAAWVGRYLLFAFGAPDQVVWMILAGVIIHGICYDFFFVTGQIYTDKKAPAGLRAQAQGMLVLFTLGIGMLIGAQVAGWVEKNHTPPVVIELGVEIQTLGNQIEAAKTSPEASAELVTELEAKKAELRQTQLEAMEWKGLWLFPAMLAAGVLLLFLVLFREKRRADTVV